VKECHGDWLAVQHGTVLAQDLKKKYAVTGIPTLVVVTKQVFLLFNNYAFYCGGCQILVTRTVVIPTSVYFNYFPD
jgi:hypothetical protein